LQHGYAGWTWCMNMHQGYAAWKCSVDMQKIHVA
jgi:hypothetical protein